MTSSINWPPGLPQQCTVQGYGEDQGLNVLNTPVDSGPAKMRKVGNRPDTLAVGFRMTTAQVATLETFIKTTLAGVKRFNFTHPRTGASRECRVIPQRNGSYYRVAYVGPTTWQVDLQLEVLP